MTSSVLLQPSDRFFPCSVLFLCFSAVRPLIVLTGVGDRIQPIAIIECTSGVSTRASSLSVGQGSPRQDRQKHRRQLQLPITWFFIDLLLYVSKATVLIVHTELQQHNNKVLEISTSKKVSTDSSTEGDDLLIRLHQRNSHPNMSSPISCTSYLLLAHVGSSTRNCRLMFCFIEYEYKFSVPTAAISITKLGVAHVRPDWRKKRIFSSKSLFSVAINFSVYLKPL